MRRYAIQKAGHDFEPISHWSTDPKVTVGELQLHDDVDLLVWNPTTDGSDIYPQYASLALMSKVEHTAYARLLKTVMQVVTPPVAAQLKHQWYLVVDLASLTHPSLLNTAAALISLAVVAAKPALDVQAQLRGLADQARCWLLAAKVSDLQLLATPKALQALYQQLLDQIDALDSCWAQARPVSWQLANDAWWLSQIESDQFELTQLLQPAAYQLLRVASQAPFDD